MRSSSESKPRTQITAVWYCPQLRATGTSKRNDMRSLRLCHGMIWSFLWFVQVLKKCIIHKRQKRLNNILSKLLSSSTAFHLGFFLNSQALEVLLRRFFTCQPSWPCRGCHSWQRSGWPLEHCQKRSLLPSPTCPAQRRPTSTSG